MLLIHNKNVADPAINLALEERCFRNLDPACEYVLFYVNRPSIIIGRHQNPLQECDLNLARRRDIHLVRRISGGGAVYHDPGNLNFSFITDFTEKKLDYFKTLLTPLLNTLQRLGVPAQLTDKNNILVNGKKISGNSQHTDMRRMLSHGTLLFNTDLDMLQRALNARLIVTESRAVSSIKSKVTNISGHMRRPMDMDAFRAALMDSLSRVFGEIRQSRVTADEWESVERLANTKYKSWDWTFGRSPGFTVHHQIKLASGRVDANFMVKNGVITDIELADKSADLSSARQVKKEFVGQRYDVSVLQNYRSNNDKV